MSTEEHVARTDDPEFFPENVEYLGFIGGWDCDIYVDTVQTLFYLIRTKDKDWLEAVLGMSRKCVMSIPRDGSRRQRGSWMLTSAPEFIMSGPCRHISRGSSRVVNCNAWSKRLPTTENATAKQPNERNADTKLR